MCAGRVRGSRRSFLSTVFDVFPSTPYLPTFEEVVTLSETKLQRFLTDLNLEISPKIKVDLHLQTPETVLPTPLQTKARWSSDHYAWFTVASVAGGTDAYFYDLAQETKESRESSEQIRSEILQRRQKSEHDERLIEGCLKQKHNWGFRRSAGQPGIVHLAYGFIASAFAELTHGFIYSDDGAWQYEKMPATPLEFDSWYMRPEFADEEYSALAKWCLARVKDDFGMT